MGAGLALALMAAGGCQESSTPMPQIELQVETNLRCDEMQGSNITLASQGELEQALVLRTFTTCTPSKDGMNSLGLLVLLPRNKQDDGQHAIKVVTAVSAQSPDACGPENGYQGCIVVRRKLTYLPEGTTRVPVTLLRECEGVVCTEDSSCFKAGYCLPDEVVCTKERCVIKADEIEGFPDPASSGAGAGGGGSAGTSGDAGAGGSGGDAGQSGAGGTGGAGAGGSGGSGGSGASGGGMSGSGAGGGGAGGGTGGAGASGTGGTGGSGGTSGSGGTGGGVCNPQDPQYGEDCSNACHGGIIGCDGVCTAEPLPKNYGQVCNNACFSGTFLCDDSCTAPPPPPEYGQVCAPSNECFSGTVLCDGSCDTGLVPGNYGLPCGPNCEGSIGCDGSCGGSPLIEDESLWICTPLPANVTRDSRPLEM